MARDRGIEKIRAQVLAQAEQEAEQIRERAEYEAQRIKRDADKQVERITASAEADAEEFQNQQKRRTDSMTRLDQRRVELIARQNLLQEVLDQALVRLKEADPEKKVEIYKSLLSTNTASDTQATAARGERDILRRAIREAGLSENIQVSKEEGAFDGGFMLRNGLVTDNLTFDAVFAVKEDELRTEAAAILFHEEDTAVSAPGSEDSPA